MPTGEPPPLKKMRAADGEGEGGSQVHLDEGMVGEILLRLPARSVLRCRAVSTAWRRVADSPKFLAAHARRRPVEILLYSRPVHGCGQEDLGLDALAVVASRSGHRRRRLASFPAVPYRYGPRPCCCVLASCDGLLLLGHGRGDEFQPYASYLVCNPATRQWTELPRVTAGFSAAGQRAGIDRLVFRESGFYHHAPSGGYRLLCHVTPDGGVQAPFYCVLSAGAGEPRRLADATPIQQTVAVVPGSDPPKLQFWTFENLMTPAALGGRLHWLQHMEAGFTDSMVAFDTEAETFCRMPPPPVACKGHSRLFVADKDTLMAAELGDLVFDLWALEGYTGRSDETTSWVLRHRVEVSWRAERPSVVSDVGDGSGDVVLGSSYGVVAYNVRSGAARRVVINEEEEEEDVLERSDDEKLLLSRSVLKESLVRHGFFDAQPHPGLPVFNA